MKLEDIQKEWSKDSIIHKDRIDDSALEIPKLHSKYINILNSERILFTKVKQEKIKLERLLEDYYNGKIDGKDIGRPPWQLEESKAGIEKRILSDDEIIKINMKISYQEEKVLLLKEVISNLNQRNFQLKVAVDFIKFMQGG